MATNRHNSVSDFSSTCGYSCRIHCLSVRTKTDPIRRKRRIRRTGISHIKQGLRVNVKLVLSMHFSNKSASKCKKEMSNIFYYFYHKNGFTKALNIRNDIFFILASGYVLGSRSTRTKLKIIFVATLILLVITVPSYIYVQSIIPKPASFQVSDLTLEEDWIQFGDPAQISVNVTNVGDEAGNYTVTVTINDEPVASKTVQLSGKESTIVEATAIGVTEGNHTVMVNDLTVDLKVTPEAPTRPATMEITSLGISRVQAGVGETIVV